MPTDKHHQMFILIREKEENAGQREALILWRLAVNSTSIRFPWHLLIFRSMEIFTTVARFPNSC